MHIVSVEDDTCQYLLKKRKSSCCIRQIAKLPHFVGLHQIKGHLGGQKFIFWHFSLKMKKTLLNSKISKVISLEVNILKRLQKLPSYTIDRLWKSHDDCWFYKEVMVSQRWPEQWSQFRHIQGALYVEFYKIVFNIWLKHTNSMYLALISIEISGIWYQIQSNWVFVWFCTNLMVTSHRAVAMATEIENNRIS